MSRIVGYSRKEKPKWPYISAAIGFLFLFLLFFLVFSAKENERSKLKPTTTSTLRKIRATTTSTLIVTTTTVKKLPDDKEKQTKDKENKHVGSGIIVEEIKITSKVSGNQPIDEINKTSGGTIYCFTKINSGQVPTEIHHVWLDADKNEIADVKLIIHSQPAYTWSYINLYDQKQGKWEVKVVDSQGKVLSTKQFNYLR